MEIVLYTLGAIFLIISLKIRYDKIKHAFISWNYFCHRYENYCLINYNPIDKTPQRLKANYATTVDFLVVFISIWKFNSHKYFNFKPDYEEIYRIYICMDFD